MLGMAISTTAQCRAGVSGGGGEGVALVDGDGRARLGPELLAGPELDGVGEDAEAFAEVDVDPCLRVVVVVVLIAVIGLGLRGGALVRQYTSCSFVDHLQPTEHADRMALLAGLVGELHAIEGEAGLWVAHERAFLLPFRKTLGGDYYVALGETIREQPGVWRIRVAHHPLIDWVFGGAGLIALGGFMSLAARLRQKASVKSSVEEATANEAPAVPATGAEAPA